MKKVLIVGGAGYIGSVAVFYFLKNGYRVRVLDKLNYGGESLLGAQNHPDFEFIQGDKCDFNTCEEACRDMNAVIDLAAIVGEPACNRDKDLAWKTNYDGTKTLLEASAAGGVKSFVFASTCSNYGIQPGDNFADESSPLNPISIYAESKVKAEIDVLAAKSANFSPTVLRFSTAFGLSPRMRFDLLISDFVRDAFYKKALLVYGPKFWRPYAHTLDITQAIYLTVEAEAKKVSGEVFNVGSDEENFRKHQIVEMVVKSLPETKVEYVDKGNDPRSYRVSAKKIAAVLGYKPVMSCESGVVELKESLEKGFFKEPYHDKYKN